MAPAFRRPQPPWTDVVAQQRSWDRTEDWLFGIAAALLVAGWLLLAYSFVELRSDIAQDLTERWIHQQQIRDAVDRPGLRDERFLGAVLCTFIWRVPLHYTILTGPDTGVVIRQTGIGGGSWRLLRQDSRWNLAELARGKHRRGAGRDG